MAKADLDVTECPLYGISPLLLATTFRVTEGVATTWKRKLRRSPRDAAAVARIVNQDLGAFDEMFKGWTCRSGLLYPPDGPAFTPGQVMAIPLMRAQLEEYDRAQAWMIRAASHGQLAEEEQRSKALDLMHAAIEALRQR